MFWFHRVHATVMKKSRSSESPSKTRGPAARPAARETLRGLVEQGVLGPHVPRAAVEPTQEVEPERLRAAVVWVLWHESHVLRAGGREIASNLELAT